MTPRQCGRLALTIFPLAALSMAASGGDFAKIEPAVNGRILVTGGAGFIGSHLCDRLIAERFEVICLDNLLTGRDTNIRHLLEVPRFRFVMHDVTEPIDADALAGLFRKGRVEKPGDAITHVVNLASAASPVQYSRHALATLKAGSTGTLHALEVARAHNATFLLASTSEVYGDPEVHPQPETYWGRVNPVGPRSMYDEAKRFSEALSAAYWRYAGVDVRIARIFNTFGPRMQLDDGRVVPTFVRQLLNDEPITVYGDGSQTRSFCFVDDLVDGLFRLLTVEKTALTSLAPEVPIVNLGNPEETTVLELARELAELFDREPSIAFRDLPVDDPRIRKPDITRAKALLDWTPKISRRDGLRRTVESFRVRPKNR